MSDKCAEQWFSGDISVASRTPPLSPGDRRRSYPPLPDLSDGDEDGALASTVNSIGVRLPSGPRHAPLRFGECLATPPPDTASVSSQDRTHAFVRPASEAEGGPRAGGVRTPGHTRAPTESGGERRISAAGATPESHRRRSVRAWQHDAAAGGDENAAEAYLRSRVRPGSVARHRPGSRSGAASPQLFRGESLGAPNADVCLSVPDSRRSSAMAGNALSSSEHMSHRLTPARHRPDAALLERVEALERRVHGAESAAREMAQRFDAYAAEMERRLGEWQRRGNGESSPSQPREAEMHTREPSRAKE